MKTIQFESEVGSDGFVSLRVPLGVEEANTRVIVTISPLPSAVSAEGATNWREFIRETYGSCAGLELEEPPDLPLEAREPIV